MSVALKLLALTCGFTALLGALAPGSPPATGIVEGHLKILSGQEVDLQDNPRTPTEAAEQPYSQYPLIIRTRDAAKEVARVMADAGGNYHVALPPGEYILDVQRRPPTRGRADPKPFTITANQTMRVDMDIDTGVR